MSCLLCCSWISALLWQHANDLVLVFKTIFIDENRIKFPTCFGIWWFRYLSKIDAHLPIYHFYILTNFMKGKPDNVVKKKCINVKTPGHRPLNWIYLKSERDKASYELKKQTIWLWHPKSDKTDTSIKHIDFHVANCN